MMKAMLISPGAGARTRENSGQRHGGRVEAHCAVDLLFSPAWRGGRSYLAVFLISAAVSVPVPAGAFRMRETIKKYTPGPEV